MKTLTAYHYTFGDGSSYWDCYMRGSFVARVYSTIEISVLATERGARSIKEI